MKKLRKVLSVLLVIAIMMTIATPVFAQQSVASENKHDNAIKKLESYLSLSENGNIILEAPKEIVKQVDGETYQLIQANLELTNKMIDDGYLVSNDNFELNVTQKYLERDSRLKAEGNTVIYLEEEKQGLRFSGVNKVDWYWWGFRLYLDNANCNRVVAGINISAALSVLLPPPLNKVAAIALIASSSIISMVNANGRGIIVRFHYSVPSPVITGIWSQ